MKVALDILKKYWGFDDFRTHQKPIVEAVLNGENCLAVLPTGGGKSLCYQVPALVKEGVCLVISPLIALMKDQIDTLRKKGIVAYAVFSGMPTVEVDRILDKINDLGFASLTPDEKKTLENAKELLK